MARGGRGGGGTVGEGDKPRFSHRTSYGCLAPVAAECSSIHLASTVLMIAWQLRNGSVFAHIQYDEYTSCNDAVMRLHLKLVLE